MTSTCRPSASSASTSSSRAVSSSSSSRAISRARERLERQVGERRPAKERERAPQQLGALGRGRASAADDLPLEAHGVDLLGVEIERVPGGQRRDRLAAELLP